MTKIATKVRAAAIALACSACSATGPVLVVTDNGQTLGGSYHVSLSGGSFSVTDGNLTCSGTYNSQDTTATITIPTLCSDGRTGIVVATRDSDGRSGFGKVLFKGRAEAEFVFGNRVQSYRPQQTMREREPQPTPSPNAESHVAEERSEVYGLLKEYVGCVLGNAKVLAVNSGESAETISRAAIASCITSRATTQNLLTQRGVGQPYETLDQIDNKLFGMAVLEVIKERVSASEPSRPRLLPNLKMRPT